MALKISPFNNLILNLFPHASATTMNNCCRAYKTTECYSYDDSIAGPWYYQVRAKFLKHLTTHKVRIQAISWSTYFKRKNTVRNSIAKILTPTLSVFSNPEPTSPIAPSSSVTTSKIVSVSSVTTSEALTPSNRTKFLSKRANLPSTQIFYEQLDQLRFF